MQQERHAMSSTIMDTIRIGGILEHPFIPNANWQQREICRDEQSLQQLRKIPFESSINIDKSLYILNHKRFCIFPE